MPVFNKYKNPPAGALYIGRGSKWGNPFVIGTHGNRDEVCDKYEQHLWNQVKEGKVTLQDLAALQGKNLVCFCAPLRCHGDTLVKAAAWAIKELQSDKSGFKI